MSQDVYRVAGSTSKKVLPKGTKCVNLEKENMEKKYVNSKDVASLGLTSGVRKAPQPFYQPTNDCLVCKDPICASPHLDYCRCDDPDECN
ncbi:hypothetical protein DCAR_0934782 [Daucus carota subsp. sativus]|uniref:Uncharacterized protein n=1 Tax=Daucus carota subsp. sativus TaxID=79200 RepID=A0A175YB30_DAUCS|nr:hypothetical protein DCAR_0934782 [Daucus carota subsp. sativus]